MMEELKKLRELTEELTGNGYLRDQADEWEYALDAMPEFVFIINTQYVIKFINKTLSEALHAKSKDVLFNKKIFDVLKIDESFVVGGLDMSVKGTEVFLEVFNKWFLCYFEPIKAGGGIIIGFICFLINITERKLAENEIALNTNRLQSLVDILKRRFDSTQDFLDYTLDVAIDITDSKLGYIYYYDEDTEEFNLNSWSKDVMAECSLLNPPKCYTLTKTGVWGEAVRQRKPIIINDFCAENSLKKGYPEGHVVLTKFMTVPVFNNDKIVAVVGVANKETDYNDKDVLQLTLIMDVVWKVVDRRLTSERLDTLTLRHYALIDAVHDIVMEVNKDKIYTWGNKAGLEFFGDDVIGKEACSYFVDEQKTYEIVQSLFDGTDKVIYVESWQIRKDGERRLLAWWCRSLKTNKGELVGVISSARDITDQKLYEDRINFLAKFPSENPDPVLRVDHNGVLLYANKASWDKLSNLSLVVGQKVPKVLQDSTIECLQSGIQKRIELECDKYIYAINVAPIAEKNYANLYGRDITYRKQYEKDLADSESRYRELYDNAPTGIYEIDLVEGKLLSVNDAICEHTGYSREELLTMNVFELLTDDSKIVFKQNMEDCAIGKPMSQTIDYHVKNKNGAEFWMVANIRYTYNGNVPVSAHVIAHDITERKNMEIELLTARENLKNSENNLKNKLLKLTKDTNQIKTIVVIDDEVAMCELIGYHLKQTGHNVVCLYDGDFSVETLVEINPDLVLLDLGLKNSSLSGQQVIEKINVIDKNLPIVVVSATSYVDDINNALKAGACDYIGKPIMVWNDLIHIVQRNLDYGALIRKNIIFNDYVTGN